MQSYILYLIKKCLYTVYYRNTAGFTVKLAYKNFANW